MVNPACYAVTLANESKADESINLSQNIEPLDLTYDPK